MNRRRFYMIGLILTIALFIVSMFMPETMGDTPALIGGIALVLIPVFLIALIVSGIRVKKRAKDDQAAPSAPPAVTPAPTQQPDPIPSPAPETAPEVSNATPITDPVAASVKTRQEPTPKKCRRCGRRGFGVLLDEDGYCPACAKLNAEYLERKAKEQEARKRKEEEIWEKIQSIPPYNFVPSDTRRKRNSGYESVVFSNITPKGKYNDIVVFDTETTGLAPSRDRIIELAAIRYKDGQPVLRFHTYVNPERPIPPEASKINDITDDMVADAPTIGSVLPAFEAFIGDSTLIAHNLDFDLRFLYYSGSNALDTKRKYIDTLEQAQKLVKKPQEVDNHRLDTLCDYYGITIAGHHSALADAYATGELFERLVWEKQV